MLATINGIGAAIIDSCLFVFIHGYFKPTSRPPGRECV
jgi:hypothetical protein